MSQVGRISGPLLFANLERNGIDLKISNTTGSSPILKFDVTNNRVGIGTETPISDLQVPNSFNTANLIVTGTVNVADFTLENNEINVNSGDIKIDSGSIIEASAVATDAIKIEENNIYGTTSNEPIELIPPTTYGNQQKLTSASIRNDLYGESVSIDGDTAVVGAKLEDFNSFNQNTGAVYVYTKSGYSWTLQTKILASTPVANAWFGTRVLIKGDLLFVGQPDNNIDDGLGGVVQSGSVTIFERTGTTWTETQILTPSPLSNEDFGDSIAYDGSTLIIGAPMQNTRTGAAYVYTKSGSTWSLQQKLLANNPSTYDYFGGSVDIEGDKAVITAQGEDTNVSGSGAVYVFERSGSTWTQTHLLKHDNPQTNDTTRAVAISGNIIVASSWYPDDFAGSAYVFTESGGTYTQTQLLKPNDTAAGQNFGASIAFDGETILIGADSDFHSSFPQTAGSAYVFKNINGTWTQTQKIAASDGAIGDEFGNSISLSGNDILIGAAPHNSNRGAAYIFNIPITDIQNDLDVDENLHATGNITFGGTITLGSDADDDITFAADVKSDIIPDVGSTYNFGLSDDGDSTYQRYSELQSVYIDTTRARANSITINGNDYGLPTGNSFYVDPNGDDANRGDHPQAPFRTIKRALDAADSSPQGMTTILIQAGEYIEEFPLTVPADTNVMGSGFREVEVKPTQGTNTEDCFLMTGETTVQNLTVMDFFYDSVNDKGYAFRYANNAITSRRSPYVQNVSVITKGSVTSASDPRGFDEGDAGRGALVDGSALDSNSVQASMLFHSVTFLTAGAIGLRMKDGVRVEWLNSFTYFADIGLKAENGTTGFVSPHDGSTRNFGAELRSIGSANVYGNKGAVADGSDCLMYLIQHNMAYIGTGKSKENDKTLVNHDNEIEKLNSGRIYFQTTDARGRFQVGDSFFADFDTGTTSIDADSVAFDTLSQITVTSGQDETFIDGTRIDTGNIVLSGNKISTSDGNLILDAVGNHDIRSNVTMKGKLDVSGDISIGQTLTTIGDAGTDTVKFNVDLDQDLKPGDGGIRSLGSTSKRWQNVYVSEANIDDIRIFDNVITTTASNADLDLRANGTGRVLLDSNDMQVTQNLTVDGTTTIPSLDITGTLNYTGDVSYPNGYDVVGDLNIRNLTVARDVHLKEFEIRGNRIDGLVTNQDVELRAAGTGRVLVDLNDALVDGNVSVRTYDVIGNVTYTGQQTSPSYATNNINIETNFIETTQSNSDLEFRASGTGRVLVENLLFRDRTITSGPPGIANGRINLTPADNLVISGTGSLKLPNGAVSQRRNELGDLRFNTERNLFEGYGASVVTLGGLYSDDQQTFVRAHPINNHLDFNVAGSQVGTINYAQVEMPGLQTDDILIDGAKITTNVSNSDLELIPNGNGEVKILTSTINLDNLSTGIIENDQAGALTISATDDGYHKIAGTYGVAIPHGTNAQRGSGNQVGDTRYNTEEAYMETWDGSVWQVSAGGGGATVSQEEMEQLILEYSLALG